MEEQKYKNTFEDLFVRQESNTLFLELYKIFSSKQFKDYFFRDQLLRAILSISNNIAEGYERETDKEFVRFLYIARGSCGESRNMIILAEKLALVDIKDICRRKDTLVKISSGIKRLIAVRMKKTKSK
ncbi:MAG: four helix bundle protein [candidate division SR1 bacterium]|nr:four helix bundle protein [candidate division SR1 bacterium]